LHKGNVEDFSIFTVKHTCMEEGRGAYRALVGKPEGRNHLKDPDVDGTIILKEIFERLDGETWTGSIWLRIGTGGGLL
jgi:hypothetical protein